MFHIEKKACIQRKFEERSVSIQALVLHQKRPVFNENSKRDLHPYRPEFFIKKGLFSTKVPREIRIQKGPFSTKIPREICIHTGLSSSSKKACFQRKFQERSVSIQALVLHQKRPVFNENSKRDPHPKRPVFNENSKRDPHLKRPIFNENSKRDLHPYRPEFFIKKGLFSMKIQREICIHTGLSSSSKKACFQRKFKERSASIQA